MHAMSDIPMTKKLKEVCNLNKFLRQNSKHVDCWRWAKHPPSKSDPNQNWSTIASGFSPIDELDSANEDHTAYEISEFGPHESSAHEDHKAHETRKVGPTPNHEKGNSRRKMKIPKKNGRSRREKKFIKGLGFNQPTRNVYK